MTETFDDKYTVIFNKETGELKALRYEEEWQDLTGNGLILAMLQEVHELRKELKPFREYRNMRNLAVSKYKKEE